MYRSLWVDVFQYIKLYVMIDIIVDWCTFLSVETHCILLLSIFAGMMLSELGHILTIQCKYMFKDHVDVCSRAPHSVLYPPMILSQFFRAAIWKAGRKFTSLFRCLNCASLAFDTSSNDIYSNHTYYFLLSRVILWKSACWVSRLCFHMVCTTILWIMFHFFKLNETTYISYLIFSHPAFTMMHDFFLGMYIHTHPETVSLINNITQKKHERMIISHHFIQQKYVR